MQLTPTEQAKARFLESMLVTAFLTGAYTVAALVISGSFSLNWSEVLFTFLLGFTYSIGHAFVAYVKAQHPDEATVIARVVDTLEARILANAPAPLQGIAGPLVVVHAPSPQNASVVSVAPDTTSGSPNVQATAQDVPETHPTAPQA